MRFDHTIYVLYGLPYIECESVLAHEFAHVWLNERFIESEAHLLLKVFVIWSPLKF